MESTRLASAPFESIVEKPATIEEAVDWLEREFPFEGYFTVGTGSHRSIAGAVGERVPIGADILDIGCGPCDKSAVLSRLGYRVTGIDDFGDHWHRVGSNLALIQRFASRAGVALVEGDGESLPFAPESFDAVTLLDVIEHLHSSPRQLLESALHLLRDGGWVVVSVPNAVNLRKRLAVMRGRTNYPPFGQFYESGARWRGHVREYTWGDLEELAERLGLEDARIEARHHMLGVLPGWARGAYRAATCIAPSVRDSLVLCGRKPRGEQCARTT